MAGQQRNQADRSTTNGLQRATRTDPYRWTAFALCLLLAATLPSLIWIAKTVSDQPRNQHVTTLEVAAVEMGVPVEALAAGRNVYITTCAVCHGANGDGVVGLGKPLRNSKFIQSSTDAEILRIVRWGRTADDPANTTGVPMPARGANAALTLADMQNVVAYLRTLQDPTQPPAAMDQWIVERVATPGQGTIGYDLFIASCSACHGPDGKGLPNMGKPLTTSTFVAERTDEQLVAFIKTGRPIWDPENTTGVDMPPKGGNPALSDDQLKDIVSYIRTLQDAAGN